MPDIHRGTEGQALKSKIIIIIIAIIIIIVVIIAATASKGGEKKKKKKEQWDVFVVTPDDPQALCVLTGAVCRWRQ